MIRDVNFSDGGLIAEFDSEYEVRVLICLAEGFVPCCVIDAVSSICLRETVGEMDMFRERYAALCLYRHRSPPGQAANTAT